MVWHLSRVKPLSQNQHGLIVNRTISGTKFSDIWIDPPHPTVYSTNIPQCTILQQKCAHFCCKMVHCGIWDWCIVGFVQQVYWAIFFIQKHALHNVTCQPFLLMCWYINIWSKHFPGAAVNGKPYIYILVFCSFLYFIYRYTSSVYTYTVIYSAHTTG